VLFSLPLTSVNGYKLNAECGFSRNWRNAFWLKPANLFAINPLAEASGNELYQ